MKYKHEELLFEEFDSLIPDFYDKETIMSYVEDGLLTSEEEGFMLGYLAA